MNRKSISLIYCAVQGFFWMGLGVCINFAAVFLQYCGFSNSELGLIMAIGNVASIVISTLTATIVDSFSRRALARCIWVLYIIQALCLGVCALFPGRTLLIAVVYCVY
ncbi:MAG: MFS transporter, partial [Oscillospiraceae bacterium]|nr:MFS transporter [Oscillospiraceae bacterium]